MTQHYEQLLAERGGRIAFAFFRLRKQLGLGTLEEHSREGLIRYHEEKRQNPKGMLWPEDTMTEKEKDAWRVLRGELPSG